MIIKKTDELIQVEELFTSFTAEVETLETSQKEVLRTLLSLKVQYEEAERASARLEGRVAQAREDKVKLTAVITQANVAWDKQVNTFKEKRINDMQDARLEYFKKGYKEAYAEIKGAKSKKPRPVSETILISRAKKALPNDLEPLSDSTE